MCRARATNFSRKTSATAEGGAGLAAGLLEGVVELVGVADDAHAAAAAAHGALTITG